MSKNEIINLPKGVHLEEIKFVFTQDSDCCEVDPVGQVLEIETQDGGGGPYIVIKTDRWAIDVDQFDNFSKILKNVLDNVDPPPIKPKKAKKSK